MRKLATTHMLSIALLSCVLATSCIQDAEPGEAPSSAGAKPMTVSEQTEPPPTDAAPTGEAKEPMTAAECYAQWKYQTMQCNNSPPNLFGTCLMITSAILAGCLATAS